MMRRFLLGFATIAPIVSLILIRDHIFVALAPLFVSHLLLLYATLVPNCQWWGPVLTRFETSEPEVWITIDDGPSPAHTPRMLEVLERFEARATFFVIGALAEKHPHLITEILAKGHALANHTQTHPSLSFWCAGPRRIAREIAQVAETLRTTPDRPERFFRAPAGLKNFFVHPALARRDLALVGWGVRGIDTFGRNPERVAERIARGAIEERVQPGAIILLHEGKRLNREPDFNPRCLELTLQRLAAGGYRFVIPNPGQLRAGGK